MSITKKQLHSILKIIPKKYHLVTKTELDKYKFDDTFNRKMPYLLQNLKCANMQDDMVFFLHIVNVFHEVCYNSVEDLHTINEFKKQYGIGASKNRIDVFFKDYEITHYINDAVSDKQLEEPLILNEIVVQKRPMLFLKIIEGKMYLGKTTDSPFKKDNYVVDYQGNPVYLYLIKPIEKQFPKLNNGKDWIKTYIFEKKTKGLLYYLTMDILEKQKTHKIGITKNTVKQRYSNLPSEIKIIKEKVVEHDDILISAIIEKYLHHKYKHLRDEPCVDFEGKNECYVNDMSHLYSEGMLPEALAFLDEIKYPLSGNAVLSIINERK